MSAIKISDHTYWVGVKDPQLRIFDIVMPTEFGTTYNAYLVKGEKVALIDTVKKGFTEEYFANISAITPLESIDYLIVNHTEPDHSGSMTELLKRCPKIQVVCAGSAAPFVKNILNDDTPLTSVKDDTEIDLGGIKVVFKMMPYMHWPDTMMEYVPEDKVLFSCDGFATHLGDDHLFDDEVKGDLAHEFRYYFDCIMRPFTGYMRRNLSKLDQLEIKMIATSHGPVLRTNPRRYIDLYKQWSADKAEGAKRVPVFYASNYGNTGLLAQTISGTLASSGLESQLVDLTTCEPDHARDLIESSIAVVIGTPTFNGDAPKPVWDFVGLFSSVYSLGKKAAVFGSYGWGGEGTKLVAERLTSMKLKVYPEPYRARLVPSGAELTDAKEFASKVAEFIKG